MRHYFITLVKLPPSFDFDLLTGERDEIGFKNTRETYIKYTLNAKQYFLMKVTACDGAFEFACDFSPNQPLNFIVSLLGQVQVPMWQLGDYSYLLAR